MSQNSSPNLSNLRHFRFQKKPSLSTNGRDVDRNGSTSNDHSPKVVRRRIMVLDSEDEKSPVKSQPNDGLSGLVAQFPLLDAQVIEKCFVECKGDVVRAREIIRISGGVQYGQKFSPVQHHSAVKRKLDSGVKEKSYKKIKRVKNDSDAYSGSDSDHDAYHKEQRRVFDSDDSDVEISDNATNEQTRVLEFLSNATLGELLCMPQISRKKADVIIELRPFDGWRDMVEKVQQSKGLGGEILNSAQDFLYTRHVVAQLMNKCSKLSSELEKMNLMGSSHVREKPSLLSAELKLADYQMIGLNWLVMLQKKGLNGILADEMGLGKTVQVIAFLAYLKENNQDDENHVPNLIVVPSSTLDNWTNELERWCPDLKVLIYYGDKEERRMIRCSNLAQGGVKDYDVVLTTYNLITASPEERKMFKVLKFKYVVFDEAHMLKNMKTTRYEQLSQINASRRILMTGTPLQNDLLELMSLLTFVMPDMFQNKKQYLKCLFTRTITKDKNDTSAEASQELPKFEQEQVANAKKIMKPFVLRRLKKDVLKDLPTKTDIIKHCPMSQRQRKLYDSLVDTYAKSASEEKTEETMAGLTMMMHLRKTANHPLLIRDLFTDEIIDKMSELLVKKTSYKEKNVDYVREDLSFLSDFELHNLCKTYSVLDSFRLSNEQILDSGKFAWLDQLLPTLFEQGHRVLIFSQFVIMLNVLESYMKIRGHPYLRFDGSTPVPVRQELIDEFNGDSNIPVFLLSTRAGGLGINLTAADHVVIHDLDFNPYNDKQAEDRCHRVGQKKPVTVYRVVSESSIEEDILQIATSKLHLEREISAQDGDFSEVKQQMLLKKVLGLDNPSPVKRLT